MKLINIPVPIDDIKALNSIFIVAISVFKNKYEIENVNKEYGIIVKSVSLII